MFFMVNVINHKGHRCLLLRVKRLVIMRIDLVISPTNFLSIQAEQEKSSSIVPSGKHLTANRHVHTAVPVTGRVTFVALKPYPHVHLHVIYLKIHASGMDGF